MAGEHSDIGLTNAQDLYSQRRARHGTGEYSVLAEELSRHDGVVAGVMCDPHFEGRETPSSLRFEHFATEWGALPGVRVVPLDANQIRSHAILFAGRMDILVYPYGSVYPMEAYGFYSGQSFNRFLARGGAVLTTGGIPFGAQASPFGDTLDTSTPEKLTDVFDKWISRFGIKYYQCRTAPHEEVCDADLLPGIAGVEWSPSAIGVAIVNSAHEPVPKPSAGNVFPERTPARTVLPLLRGRDRWGRDRCVSAALAQDFEDGSRRIHFTHESEPHPLSPAGRWFTALMRALYELLANRVFAKDVETEYACYRQGEDVVVRAEVVSFEQCDADVVLVTEILTQDGSVVHRVEKPMAVAPRAVTRHEAVWSPGSFASDEYTVRATIQRSGRTVSRCTNGFVVWTDDVVHRGPDIGIRGQYFTLGGKTSYITGTNYYESTRGEAMWFRPNVAAVIRDHRQMRDCGVRMIRPHYHHLKWFRDYLVYHHGRLPEFYRELEGLEDPLPDERVWRIWDMFVYLGRKYGIAYNGDLFTLVPSEMGDPRGWFGTVEAVLDRSCRPVQKQFLTALDRRFRGIPGITWDLFNEPHMVADEAVCEWASDLRSALEADGADRLITVGGPMHLPSATDYDCPHGALTTSFRSASVRPVLLQELHVDQTEPLEAELAQAELFRTYALTAIHVGAAGWLPWSWTRQMRLWQDSYEHHHSFPMEKWDDRLGMHAHEDGTLKPAGVAFRDLAALLAGIEPLSHDPITHEVTTSQGILRVVTNDKGTPVGREHMSGPECLAVLARGRIDVCCQPLVRGPERSCVHLRAVDSCFADARELLVKTDLPGEIVVYRDGAAAVDLVDAATTTVCLLEPLHFTSSAGTTRVSVTDEMTCYWVRLRFA